MFLVFYARICLVCLKQVPLGFVRNKTEELPGFGPIKGIKRLRVDIIFLYFMF